MRINIINEYGDIDINLNLYLSKLKREFNKRFSRLNKATLIFVSLDKIHEINKEYRNIDRPTDVISFEEHEGHYLGEIFLCIDKAREQAKEYGHSLEREISFLICHGLLHLNGYDHTTKEDEEVMFKLQDEIIDKVIKR